MKQYDDDTRIEEARKAFAKKRHKATLLQNTERYTIIDWRRENGSGEYYVNYIIDKKRGSLIISGDLGDCIATWYSCNSVHDIARYINNVSYFISKFQCASNSYDYDEDDILEDIREELTDSDVECTEEFEADWDNFTSDFGDDVYRDGFHPSRDKTEFLENYLGPDWWESVSNWGRRINRRVFFWIAGFNMAVEQLDAAGLLSKKD